jgi:hypothetical protein
LPACGTRIVEGCALVPVSRVDLGPELLDQDFQTLN